MPHLKERNIDLATRLFSKMGVEVEYIVQEGMLSIDNMAFSIGVETETVDSIRGPVTVPSFVLYDGDGDTIAWDTAFSVLLVRAAWEYTRHFATNFVDSEPHEIA